MLGRCCWIGMSTLRARAASRMWDNGECRPVLDRAQFLARISRALSFVCAEFSTFIVVQIRTSIDSSASRSVASNRLFETSCVSSERSFPEPQLLSRLGLRRCVHCSLSQAHCLTCLLSHQFCHRLSSLFSFCSHVVTHLTVVLCALLPVLKFVTASRPR